MKKRLRKKKHVGEFTEYGIEISIKFNSNIDSDQFLDDFIENAIERNGLLFGGGHDNITLEGVIELGRSDKYLLNSDKVSIFLKQHSAIKSHTLSEPFDIYYPPNEL